MKNGFFFLRREALQQLVDVLRESGHRCVGPTVQDGAIVYRPIGSVEELPRNTRDEQAPGHYRLQHQESGRHFAWANGPLALKPLTFAPRETLWRARRDAEGRLQFENAQPPSEKTAVIGVRACDLAALRLQDAHFIDKVHDPYYAARRQGMFLVAVHCSHPAATCFCASTGDGPTAEFGFDIALHELDDGFVVQIGSEAGRKVADRLPLQPAGTDKIHQAQTEQRRAAESQQRTLPGRNLRDSLFANLQHDRWQDVAERCLSCGNCTSVCPTCFCHNENEVPALDGKTTEHGREWDSCFTQGHSYLHGHVVRPDTQTRYRQWLTHKLGSWHDQYGRSGCVGCGRCISWCPVGIDLTEEAHAICD